MQLSISESYFTVSDHQDRVVIYEVKSSEPMFTIKGHTLPVIKCCFIKSDSCLITASKDCTLAKWDVITSERLTTFNGHEAPLSSLVVSHEGIVVSGSEDGIIIV